MYKICLQYSILFSYMFTFINKSVTVHNIAAQRDAHFGKLKNFPLFIQVGKFLFMVENVTLKRLNCTAAEKHFSTSRNDQ